VRYAEGQVLAAIKSRIWCAIWILGALLVIATLDKVPDPPAANPGKAQIHTCCPHEVAVATFTPVQSFRTIFRQPLRHEANGIFQPLPVRGWIVLIEQASDPSPPSLQVRVKTSSQT
jgi:hypothetical protein